MNKWGDKMHDLYLKVSPLLITLSVAAIGFAASYILDGRYHSGNYQTALGYIVLFCLFVGVCLLIVSCGCGLLHLLNSLQFVQCTMRYFAERYIVAAKRYKVVAKRYKVVAKRYKVAVDIQYPTDTHTNEEKNTRECKNPPSWPWHLQIWSFLVGIFLLICWVMLDFLVTWQPANQINSVGWISVA